MFNSILNFYMILIVPNDTNFPYETPEPVKSNTIYVKFC